MEKLNNRYEFVCYLSCVDTNPNGDPDMGNLPRVDPRTMQGLITDAAIKRRIRDYIGLYHEGEPGMDLFVAGETNLNRKIVVAKELAGVDIGDKTKDGINKARLKACEMFFDVRAFGAVMSTGPNAGQVRGPVQIQFARSLDPIQTMDIGITRVATATDIKGAKSAADYAKAEEAADADSLRTMGRKQLTPYGLYVIHGYVSPRLAWQTGFDMGDLRYLLEAVANMYDVMHTASKGSMTMVSPVIIFRHCGDPGLPEDEQLNQALLGRAQAQDLFDLVEVQRRPGVKEPRSHMDYTATIDLDGRPDGIDIGFLMPFGVEIEWNQVPGKSRWLKAKGRECEG